MKPDEVNQAIAAALAKRHQAVDKLYAEYNLTLEKIIECCEHEWVLTWEGDEDEGPEYICLACGAEKTFPPVDAIREHIKCLLARVDGLKARLAELETDDG